MYIITVIFVLKPNVNSKIKYTYYIIVRTTDNAIFFLHNMYYQYNCVHLEKVHMVVKIFTLITCTLFNDNTLKFKIYNKTL